MKIYSEVFSIIGFVGNIGGWEIILIFLVGLIVVLPYWIICKKAGLSPWLSLIMFIPLGAFILPFILAFKPWPSLKSPSQAKQGSGGNHWLRTD